MKIAVSGLPLVTQPISIAGAERRPVNFTALESRLTKAIRNNGPSAQTVGRGWMFQEDLSFSCLGLQIVQYITNQFLEIDVPFLQSPAPDARELQQVVNQLPHSFC